MKKIRSILAMVMAFCLVLTAVSAFAEKSLEGDANVDQRNYPSTTPFIHPPFYNVKLIVEADDNGVITSVSDNGITVKMIQHTSRVVGFFSPIGGCFCPGL